MGELLGTSICTNPNQSRVRCLFTVAISMSKRSREEPSPPPPNSPKRTKPDDGNETRREEEHVLEQGASASPPTLPCPQFAGRLDSVRTMSECIGNLLDPVCNQDADPIYVEAKAAEVATQLRKVTCTNSSDSLDVSEPSLMTDFYSA